MLRRLALASAGIAVVWKWTVGFSRSHAAFAQTPFYALAAGGAFAAWTSGGDMFLVVPALVIGWAFMSTGICLIPDLRGKSRAIGMLIAAFFFCAEGFGLYQHFQKNADPPLMKPSDVPSFPQTEHSLRKAEPKPNNNSQSATVALFYNLPSRSLELLDENGTKQVSITKNNFCADMPLTGDDRFDVVVIFSHPSYDWKVDAGIFSKIEDKTKYSFTIRFYIGPSALMLNHNFSFQNTSVIDNHTVYITFSPD